VKDNWDDITIPESHAGNQEWHRAARRLFSRDLAMLVVAGCPLYIALQEMETMVRENEGKTRRH
jgi:type II secretory pathway component PulF